MSLDRSVMPVRVRDENGNFVTIEQDAQGRYRFFVSSQSQGAELANNGQVFVSIIDGLNLGTGASEKDVFLIKNPVASGYNIQLKEIVLVTVKASGGTGLRYYRNPTITTDGNALSERNKRDDTTTGVGTTFQLPTISARGILLGSFGVAGSAQLRQSEDFELRLAEGESLLVTIEQPSSNQTYSLNVIWSEEPI
jgi:hypothetical protein